MEDSKGNSGEIGPGGLQWMKGRAAGHGSLRKWPKQEKWF